VIPLPSKFRAPAGKSTGVLDREPFISLSEGRIGASRCLQPWGMLLARAFTLIVSDEYIGRAFIAGGIAACGAVTATHPFETVKIR
jgi:hypothetical protein